jgi:N-acylneuraminate cytidylyltransferase
LNIAIIPARGNSIRIKRKNTKIFCGKPIIKYSIDAAKKTKLFDMILVSTDNNRITKVSKKYGATVPFKRPKKLSDDSTGIIEVVAHSIKWLRMKNIFPNYVCCIFATAPLIQHKKIIEGLKILKKNKTNFLISATNYSANIHRSFIISDKKKRIKLVFKKKFYSKKSDEKKIFHDAGQFYWAKAQTWVSKKKMFTSKSSIIKLKRKHVQDINTIEDWQFAKLLFNKAAMKF